MANIKSAKKRVLIAERNRLRNKAYKSAVRTLIKKYLTELEAYGEQPSEQGMERVQQAMSLAYQKIDKAVKRHVLHANNGSRKKARLARALSRAVSSGAEQSSSAVAG